MRRSNTMTVQDAITQKRRSGKGDPRLANEKAAAGNGAAHRNAIKSRRGRRAAEIKRRQRPSNDGQGPKTSHGQRPGFGGGARVQGAPRSGPGASQAGTGGNGPPDFQRMLSRLPNSKLADLQKGDAVMIVSTEGGNSDAVTAITLLAGVERHSDRGAQSKRILIAFAVVARRARWRRRGSRPIATEIWARSVLVSM
jgi:hypothetical protein